MSQKFSGRGCRPGSITRGIDYLEAQIEPIQVTLLSQSFDGSLETILKRLDVLVPEDYAHQGRLRKGLLTSAQECQQKQPQTQAEL
jgi:hypothetical protein